MKAIIRLDVPDWQIGQEVKVYFPDTMCVKGICEDEESPKGNYSDYLSEKIRWTDKVSVISNGDIVDFDGRVVGHINLEDYGR